MNEIIYDMVYLLGCGVNGTTPEKNIIQKYSMEQENLKLLYQISSAHLVDALTGTVLKQAGVKLPAIWEQSIAKAVRKVILFDAERAKLLAYMEQNKIWYLPLKGIILKDYYPSVGMRQMSDNDILFDDKHSDDIRNYMMSLGYQVESFGCSNHDVYKKKPVYNFEMHRALYAVAHDSKWETYYREIKNKLILNEGSSYGYHMSPEDFYIYIICHGCKHYRESGTGIRTLLDFYVYLNKMEQKMDFSYIEKECEILGIAKYERENRTLCKKVFGEAGSVKDTGAERYSAILSENEQKMFKYYLTSGVYGTTKQRVQNYMKNYETKGRKVSKAEYILRRLFPGKEEYQKYPIVNNHRWLLPGFWIYRILKTVCNKGDRKIILRELKTVIKSASSDKS